jgi:hypothetical protein
MPLQCIIVDDYQRFLKVARAKLDRQGMAVVGVAPSRAPWATHHLVVVDRMPPGHWWVWLQGKLVGPEHIRR